METREMTDDEHEAYGAMRDPKMHARQVEVVDAADSAINAAVAAEREACAKVAESISPSQKRNTYVCRLKVAAAIRARAN
jgi:hypothetical protein